MKKPIELKFARLKAGHKQWDFADMIGIRNYTLCNIENGRKEPSKEIKEKCSKLLGIPVKDLF